MPRDKAVRGGWSARRVSEEPEKAPRALQEVARMSPCRRKNEDKLTFRNWNARIGYLAATWRPAAWRSVAQRWRNVR